MYLAHTIYAARFKFTRACALGGYAGSVLALVVAIQAIIAYAVSMRVGPAAFRWATLVRARRRCRRRRLANAICAMPSELARARVRPRVEIRTSSMDTLVVAIQAFIANAITVARWPTAKSGRAARLHIPTCFTLAICASRHELMCAEPTAIHAGADPAQGIVHALVEANGGILTGAIALPIGPSAGVNTTWLRHPACWRRCIATYVQLLVSVAGIS